MSDLMRPVGEDFGSARDVFFSFFEQLFWPIDSSERLSSQRKDELFKAIWLGSEPVSGKAKIQVTLPQFNSLLTEYGHTTVGEEFYRFFFPTLSFGGLLGDFINGIQKFMKVAMWKFGSFRRALEKLGNSSDLGEEFKNVPLEGFGDVDESVFKNRPEPPYLDDLTPMQRCHLGYVIGDCPKLMQRQIAEAREIGKKNASRYLYFDHIDIYVATSLRNYSDVQRHCDFVQKLFNDQRLKELRLRYFDPTIAYVESRRNKGLLECLMLKRAKLTIYIAGEADSFGKDSECAATLAQGKPVLVYIENADKLKGRVELFQNHPLGMQVCLCDGVACGVSIVKSVEECAEIVSQLFLHRLATHVSKETPTNDYVLCDEVTNSPLRIVSADRELTTAFWNYYLKEE